MLGRMTQDNWDQCRVSEARFLVRSPIGCFLLYLITFKAMVFLGWIINCVKHFQGNFCQKVISVTRIFGVPNTHAERQEYVWSLARVYTKGLSCTFCSQHETERVSQSWHCELFNHTQVHRRGLTLYCNLSSCTHKSFHQLEESGS